mmetsp:Transcript_8907/g.20203  ORF Transcript_8907/g.20203 Transcript_8907/m.20203 type:complete len:82 (-) Transcript_8907:36-281(-)
MLLMMTIQKTSKMSSTQTKEQKNEKNAQSHQGTHDDNTYACMINDKKYDCDDKSDLVILLKEDRDACAYAYAYAHSCCERA